MNEKQKKITIVLCFFFLVLFILIQSIADNIAIRRADTTIDSLTQQLDDTQRRLTDCRTEIAAGRDTIVECRSSIRRVNSGLEQESTRVSDIIENLKRVRTEIENMENAIDYFYNKYGDNIDNLNNMDGEVE